MKKNGVLDILCKIISVLLSIVLVAALIVTVLFASVTNLLKPETLTEIITDIDYSDLLSDAVGQQTAEKLKGSNNTLSFNPVLLMAYNINALSAEVAYNIIIDEGSGGDGNHANVQYYGENTAVNIHGSANNGAYVVDEDGNVIYNGEVIGNISGNEPGGENVQFNGAEVTVIDPDNVPESDNSTSTTIIGGADGPTSIVVGEPSVDLSQFGIPEIPGIDNPMEIVNEFMESDVAKEILGEYTTAVNDAIQGKETEVDKEKIKEIVVENKEEIIDFVIKYTGDKVSRSDLEQVFDTVIDERFDDLAQFLPEPQEIVEAIPQQFIDIINILNSGIILKVLIAIDAVLVLLIFVLRLWNFAGFLWLSIDGIVSGVILMAVYLVLNFAQNIVLGALPSGKAIFEAVFNAVLNRMLIAFLLILLISAIFMVVFFIIKKFRKKKSEAK